MDRRVAVLLHGGMSKLSKRFLGPASLYDPGPYVNYVACYNSTVQHLVQANPDCRFDFFIQSWNEDLQPQLEALYRPVAVLFEDNNRFKDDIVANLARTRKALTDFGYNSKLLAITHVTKLLQTFATEKGVTYDYVILYRPDVLLWKDMRLSEYNVRDHVYCNRYGDCQGDFHFVMNLQDAYNFEGIYATTKTNNCVTDTGLHERTRNFIRHVLKRSLRMDSIDAGKDQEVLRQLQYTSVERNHVPVETFFRYGLSKEEIASYTTIK